jgi:hypothetical protein
MLAGFRVRGDFLGKVCRSGGHRLRVWRRSNNTASVVNKENGIWKWFLSFCENMYCEVRGWGF